MVQKIIFNVLMIVIVFLILVLLFNILFKSIDKNIDDRIANALKAAGINTKSQENFVEVDVVYDSYDKIKNNFEKYINTFLPILNVNEMNKLIQKYTNTNKTIDNIISDNINKNYEGYIKETLKILGSQIQALTTNEIDNILGGVVLINLLNIEIINKQNINYKLYYLDDYNKTKDFVIYFIPNNYDKTNIDTNTAENFTSIDDLSNSTKLYKYSINNELFKSGKQLISTKKNKPMDEITDDDVKQLIIIFRKNPSPLIKYLQLLLIMPIVKLQTKTTITINEGLGKDFFDLFNVPNSFTDDIKPYLPSGDMIPNMMGVQYIIK